MNGGLAFFLLVALSLLFYSLTFVFENSVDDVVELPPPRDPSYFYFDNTSKVLLLDEENYRREFEDLLFLNYILENSGNSNKVHDAEVIKDYIVEYSSTSDNKIVSILGGDGNLHNKVLLHARKEDVKTEADYDRYQRIKALKEKRKKILSSRIQQYFPTTTSNSNNNGDLFLLKQRLALQENLIFEKGEEQVSQLSLYVYLFFQKMKKGVHSTDPEKGVWEHLSAELTKRNGITQGNQYAVPVHLILAESGETSLDEDDSVFSIVRPSKQDDAPEDTFLYLKELYEEKQAPLHHHNRLRYLLLALENRQRIPIGKEAECEFMYFGFLRRAKRDPLTSLVVLNEYNKVPVLLVLTKKGGSQCTSAVLQLDHTIFEYKSISLITAGEVSPLLGVWTKRKRKSSTGLCQSPAMAEDTKATSEGSDGTSWTGPVDKASSGLDRFSHPMVPIGSVCVTHNEIETDSATEKIKNRRFADKIKTNVLLKTKNDGKRGLKSNFFSEVPPEILHYMQAFFGTSINGQETEELLSRVLLLNCGESKVELEINSNRNNSELVDAKCRENVFRDYYEYYYRQEDMNTAKAQLKTSRKHTSSASTRRSLRKEEELQSKRVTRDKVACLTNPNKKMVDIIQHHYQHTRKATTTPPLVILKGARHYTYNLSSPHLDKKENRMYGKLEDYKNESMVTFGDNHTSYFYIYHLLPTGDKKCYLLHEKPPHRNTTATTEEEGNIFMSWIQPKNEKDTHTQWMAEEKDEFDAIVEDFVTQQTNGVLLYHFMKDGGYIEGSVECSSN